jgi:hypothetical protein
MGQAASILAALNYTAQIHCGHFADANSLLEQLIALSDQKGALLWKAFGMCVQGWVPGDASGAVHRLTSGMTAFAQPARREWCRGC